MLKDLFVKRQYATVKPSVLKVSEEKKEEKPNIPSGMWTKCDKCSAMIYQDDLENHKYVCPNCGQKLSGKTGCNVICGICNTPFEMED